MIDVCITIVNTNEKEEIRHSLKTLFADSVDSGLSIKIIIVDNNSTDKIEELSNEFLNLQIISQKNNCGFGASHNLAFKAVDAHYYFILNPDTEFFFGGNFLRKMVDFMDLHPKIGLSGPKIVYPDGSLQYSCYRFPVFMQPLFSRTKFGKTKFGKRESDRYLMKDFDHNSTCPVDWVMGSAMFLRKEAYDEVGGFDERFWMYAEDSDLCRRLWEANWAVYYVYDICFRHTHNRASSKTPGVLNALINNRYTRTHIYSWLKYFWKWRGSHKFYR